MTRAYIGLGPTELRLRKDAAGTIFVDIANPDPGAQRAYATDVMAGSLAALRTIRSTGGSMAALLRRSLAAIAATISPCGRAS